jgi:hypothetical protein
VAASAFEFASFHLGIDPDTLRSGYPRSSHEFWATPSGVIVTPRENLPRFRELLGRATGSYVLRVSPDDLVEDVFYVQIELDAGRVRKLVLRFEIPHELRKTRQGPSCDAMRRKLTDRYGSPARTGPGWYEEAVFHWPIVWEDADTTLTWDCGEYAIIIRPR